MRHINTRFSLLHTALFLILWSRMREMKSQKMGMKFVSDQQICIYKSAGLRYIYNKGGESHECWRINEGTAYEKR